MQIDLTGWVHVHTWHESHGEQDQATYQRDDRAWAWSRRPPELLTVTTYRDGRPSQIRTSNDRDYLLARAIRANIEGAYTPRGGRSVSPCCTSGHEDFDHAATGRVFRIFGAAGHGEWAFDVTDEMEA